LPTVRGALQIGVNAAANLFIKRYGDTAAIEAALRADEFGAKSDIDGQRAWIRIMEPIKQLQRTRSPGEPVN
jgi:hypothetical protein